MVLGSFRHLASGHSHVLVEGVSRVVAQVCSGSRSPTVLRLIGSRCWACSALSLVLSALALRFSCPSAREA
jgi:hypothetical protein